MHLSCIEEEESIIKKKRRGEEEIKAICSCFFLRTWRKRINRDERR